MQETYLNHPTFGLLYSLCVLSEREALFTTLYTQRLFFRVTYSNDAREALSFDPVSRQEARILFEEQLRLIRRNSRTGDLERLQTTYKQMFS